MKLLLTSNGFMNTSLEKDFLEITGNKTNLKVAIIPTASDPIEWVKEKEGDQPKDYVAKLNPEKREQNDAWLNSYKEEWEKKGYSVIIADLKEGEVELKKKLERVDIIDVTGGDVNWLLDWAKKSKLDTYLKDLLSKGVVYVGASAGSMLLQPDIGLSWWDPEKWGGIDHIGLGVIDFIVYVHQKETETFSDLAKITERKKYYQSVVNFPWKIYLLNDGQAIKVVDDKVTHIGPGIKKFIP